jgi:hypothetical protein
LPPASRGMGIGRHIGPLHAQSDQQRVLHAWSAAPRS